MVRPYRNTGQRQRRIFAEVLAENPPFCCVCGGRIDFDAPPRTSNAPSVDHAIPRMVDDSNELDLAKENLRPAHFGCNSARGNRMRAGNPDLHTTRRW